MSIKYCVFFYSKYSSHSKKMLDLMQTSNIDFVTQISLKSVCVDNSKIRERILSSMKLDVKYVPCIMVIYDSGIIEKFDGNNAFDWLNRTIDIIRSQTIEVIPPPVVQPVQPIQQPSKKKKVVKKEIEIEEEVEEVEEDEEEVEEVEDIIKPQKKKILLMKNKGNYDIIESDELIGEIPEQSRPSIKPSGRKGDIVAEAKEMEKMRNLEMSKMNKNQP